MCFQHKLLDSLLSAAFLPPLFSSFTRNLPISPREQITSKAHGPFLREVNEESREPRPAP